MQLGSSGPARGPGARGGWSTGWLAERVGSSAFPASLPRPCPVQEPSSCRARVARAVIAALVTFAATGACALAIAGDLVINELHYDPADKTSREEFIELYNTAEHEVDVSGWFFSSGVEYTLPPQTKVPSHGYLVVAEDPATLASALGFAGSIGPFLGSLSNDGERVVLRSAQGEIEDEVEYGVGFPWPLASAGEGSSMELIHPLLDNNLGGSWRGSGLVEVATQERIVYLDSEAPDWRYRRGISEPPPEWTNLGFEEDATWRTGQTSIGFGDANINTELADMKDNYATIYLRREFVLPPGALPASLKLEILVDDGAVVWINGIEVLRVGVLAGAPPAFDANASRSVEAVWEDFLLPDPRAYLVAGENVIAIHVLNRSIASNDLSIDVRLLRPGTDDVVPAIGPPTPGRANSVLAENAAPQVRQVDHALAVPKELEANTVTAKVTDPEGVARVRLRYQVVQPGQHIPAFFPVPLPTLLGNANAPRPPNPAFEDPANWATLDMRDDGLGGDEVAGDAAYTAVIPGQANRALVRYRIEAADTLGQSVRVPYRDDPSLNFAYMVYNGIPEYSAPTSILGQAVVYPVEVLESLPVYFLFTRNQDLVECIAPTGSQQIDQSNPARHVENWEGTWVYEGVVYDHIRYRLRGGNGRYQDPAGNPGGTTGKRKYKVAFNAGKRFRARDRYGKRYPTEWRALNIGRMFGNRIDGNWSLSEQVNDIIWSAYGVPAPIGYNFHFRVVDGPDEAPGGAQGQYLGDFFGIAHAFEFYDGQFLAARNLPKGNVYKLTNRTSRALDELRYQGPYAVKNGADHDNLESSLRATQTDVWLQSYVDYDEWYRYHAIVQAIRHYDYWPGADKNAALYFYPDYTAANRFFGRMWTLPDDTDATWGPNWNSGIDRPYDSIYGPPAHVEMQKAYRGHIREVRDLLWQRDQLEMIIRHVAAFMKPLETADIDRWRNGTQASGRQYFSAPTQRDLEGKFRDMMNFAFVGGSWPDQNVGAGGRAVFLDQFADGPDASRLPAKPVITYTGPAGFPADRLSFEASPFSDPQGSSTFLAMKWRLAEVSDISGPGTRPLEDPIWTAGPVKLEITPTWESEDLTVLNPTQTIPAQVVKPGHKYRVRVRVEDDTNLWSHWSDPIELIAGAPTAPLPAVRDLRITEIMYNAPGGTELEFLELQNKGSEAIDLQDVTIDGGIEFSFADSEVKSLGPDEIIVFVDDLQLFARRYDVGSILVAGVYSGNLSNGGEQLRLRVGEATVLDFSYSDSWFPETDGGGRSLNVVDVNAPAEAWGGAAQWVPSSVEGGTPGLVDPGSTGAQRVVPSDGDADGKLNITDALILLNLLFGGGAGRLPPCDGSVTEGGNAVVFDHNGDGGVDLTDAVRVLQYLFSGGAPHVLGVDCVPIPGCRRGACGP